MKQIMFYLLQPSKAFPFKGNICFKVSQDIYQEFYDIQKKIIDLNDRMKDTSFGPFKSQGKLEGFPNWKNNYEINITAEKILLYVYGSSRAEYHIYQNIKNE